MFHCVQLTTVEREAKLKGEKDVMSSHWFEPLVWFGVWSLWFDPATTGVHRTGHLGVRGSLEPLLHRSQAVCDARNIEEVQVAVLEHQDARA